MWRSTLLFLSLTAASVTAGGDWSYSGQSSWPKIDKQCSGRSQSPVDIDTSKVKYDESLAVTFRNFNKNIPGHALILSNNGHTVTLQLNDESISGDSIPLVKGPALADYSFKFAQLHFHWHMDQTSGSEHAINGRKYALEMHYVHVNTKYSDIREASQNKDGLAVFGTLFQVTRKNNSYLDPLIAGVGRVRDQGTNTTLFGSFVMLDQLLPNDLDHFFKYSGSLTTPPCSESVTWIVFREISGISAEQMSYFRSLMRHTEEHDKTAIGSNIRDLQKIRKREILASGIGSGGVNVTPPALMLPLLLIITICCRHQQSVVSMGG